MRSSRRRSTRSLAKQTPPAASVLFLKFAHKNAPARRGSHRRSWSTRTVWVIDGGQVGLDGRFQFPHAAMRAAPDLFIGERSEPAFHEIDPGGAGRREVHAKTRCPASWRQPGRLSHPEAVSHPRHKSDRTVPVDSQAAICVYPGRQSAHRKVNKILNCLTPICDRRRIHLAFVFNWRAGGRYGRFTDVLAKRRQRCARGGGPGLGGRNCTRCRRGVGWTHEEEAQTRRRATPSLPPPVDEAGASIGAPGVIARLSSFQ